VISSTRHFRNFGARLKTYRTDRHMTLERMAARLGIHKQTLWNVEQGKDVLLSTADKIMTSFGGVDAFYRETRV